MPCHRMLRALALRATTRSLTRGQTILAFARPRFSFVLSVLRREILFFISRRQAEPASAELCEGLDSGTGFAYAPIGRGGFGC